MYSHYRETRWIPQPIANNYQFTLKLTREGDEVDTPTNSPEPANQHKGDGEELGKADHAVGTHDV